MCSLDAFGKVALNHEFNALDGGAAEIRNKWRLQGNNHVGFGGLMVRSYISPTIYLIRLDSRLLQLSERFPGSLSCLLE